MPILPNLKQERFAQGIASGLNGADAARSAGYSKERACQQASTLRKVPKVAARIAELNARVVNHLVSAVTISKAWVMDQLMDTAKLAREKEQLSVVRACLVDIGRELGMFTEKPARKFIDWDGDVSSLSDQELEQLQYLMERLAWGSDEAKIQSERRRIAAEAGVNVIDVSPAGSEVSPQVEVKKEDW